MADSLHIIKADQADKVLNKEQRRFNSLVRKISLLREQISLAKELDLELRRMGDEKVKPVEDLTYSLFCEWIFILHNHPAKSKLSKKLSDKFSLIMLEEIENLIRENPGQDTSALEELYSTYEAEGRNFDDVMEETDLEEKRMAAQMMNMMFGMDIDPEDLDNPEKMQEKIGEKQAEFEEYEQKRQEKQQQRKKTEAQKAAEEKRLAAQTSVKKTAKQIYLDLVRHFHPDREQDEEKRAEKTEIMKQITGAYEADDHLRLLELQMNLLASRDNVFAGFDNLQLKYFNQTLQKQVAELEQELYFSSPDGNGNVYGHLFSPLRSMMLRNIELYLKRNKQSHKELRHNMSLIRDEKVFKQFVRDFELPDFW